MQIYTGLDLSRKRLDWYACAGDGQLVDRGAVPPDPDGLAQLVRRLDDHGCARCRGGDERCPFHPRPARASRLGRAVGRSAALAGAGAACLQDRPDRRLGAGRAARRDLVPEVRLPHPEVRGERERARFRMHLVKHRTMLKNRIHQTLIAHGQARPTANLFTQKGRNLLARLQLPEPWQGTTRCDPAADRSPRRADRQHRARPANARRQPPLRPAAHARSPASPGCSPTRSPPRSATSAASRARAS